MKRIAIQTVVTSSGLKIPTSGEMHCLAVCAWLTLPERSRLDHRVDGERQCVRKGNEPSRKEKREAACCDQEWAFVWEAYSLLWW